MTFETVHADEERVLEILRASDRPLAWSAIASRLHDVPRVSVTMPQVRGVRDACRVLEARGLAYYPGMGLSAARRPLRQGLVRFGVGPGTAA